MTLTIEQRLAALESAVGDPKLVLAPGAPRPAELPNGQYNLMYSEYQLHAFANALVGTAGDDGSGGQIGRIETRLKALESKPAPAPSQSVDVVAQLAALNIHARQGKLGIGMVPLDDASAQIQMEGDRGVSILGRSNTLGTDKQNPGEVHTHEIHVCDNDGGLRFLQYGFWGKDGFIRNTLNRRHSVVALDSMGDLCGSHIDVGATKDGGQSWYLITNMVEKFVRLCTFKAGWKIQVREASTQYAATETDVIAAAVEAALKARGL